MKSKVLVFVNSYGSTSETFVTDEIDFLSAQENLDLKILHYGKDIPENNISGLKMESSFTKRWVKALLNFDGKVLRSLQYINGVNGSLASLIPFFKKNKFDTIYCHFGTNGKLIAQLQQLGVISKETKLVVRFHGLDMNFKKYPKNFYQIFQKYNPVVLYGTQMAFGKLTDYGLKERAVFLPVGIKNNNIKSTKEIKEEHLAVTSFKILSVGRFIELKGHEIAVEIMERLESYPIVLQIIGDGERFNKIKTSVEEKNLGDKVILLGKKTHQEVFFNLQNSHIYLYSGIYDSEGRCENQATSVLEAMAQGKVVVTSALGGITDYIFENETGFLCEPGNSSQFAKKLQWIMGNYNTPEMFEIRKNAMRMVEENYCQEDLNNKLLKLLRE